VLLPQGGCANTFLSARMQAMDSRIATSQTPILARAYHLTTHTPLEISSFHACSSRLVCFCRLPIPRHICVRFGMFQLAMP
jgi:hypothetical protein